MAICLNYSNGTKIDVTMFQETYLIFVDPFGTLLSTKSLAFYSVFLSAIGSLILYFIQIKFYSKVKNENPDKSFRLIVLSAHPCLLDLSIWVGINQQIMEV